MISFDRIWQENFSSKIINYHFMEAINIYINHLIKILEVNIGGRMLCHISYESYMTVSFFSSSFFLVVWQREGDCDSPDQARTKMINNEFIHQKGKFRTNCRV